MSKRSKVARKKGRSRGGARRLVWALSALTLLAGAGLWYANRSSLSRPSFDGQRAFQHLLNQCAFGPRNPGSEGHRRCLEYLAGELRKQGGEVELLPFTYSSKREPGRVWEGTNIRAFVKGTKRPGKRVLLCAHWDTRPFADRDPRPENRAKPILGANDGASGVAVVLEMARVLRDHPPPVGVDLVLFDLEDMGEEGWAEGAEDRDPFCIGSRTFVAQHPDYRPDFGILLDMVGKRELRIRKEGFSLDRAPRVVEKVWSAARRVGSRAFVEQRAMPVFDDHVPFLERGIPVIDLIDMDYPQWHTLDDTPERCAPESLQQVGDVLVEVIYSEK